MNETGNSGGARPLAEPSPPDRSAGTRERLIEGALRCLRSSGLAGTTSRAIARASGENLAAITYHFGSKDELVSQALLRAIRKWLEPALDSLRGPGHPALRMTGAVQALQESLKIARDLLPVYLEALVEAGRSDSLRAGVEELFAELRAFLTAQIEELKRMDFLPAWVDPQAMATLLVATGDGIAMHTALDPDAVDVPAVAAQAMQLLLAAAGPDQSDPRRKPPAGWGAS